MSPAARDGAPQADLELGDERTSFGESTIPLADQLRTEPCPTCGDHVVCASFVSSAAPGVVLLDPSTEVYITIGQRTDATAIVTRTPNAMARHACKRKE